MKMNQLNEIVVDENDLVEGMLEGKRARYVITQDTEKIDSYNHFCTLFKFEDTIDYETPAETNDKYSYTDANNWWMPEEYRTLDIEQYLLKFITTPQQRERVYAELEEFKNRKMLPMLQFLVYMVTELKQHNILWGVGRGSSVSSYILYLIGVHKIDSIKYNLDYKEFLR